MAKIESYIPFCLQWETRGFRPQWAKLSPEQCYNNAAKNGFASIPGDSGGATMCGVTLKTYTAYCRGKGYPHPTVEQLKKLPYGHWREIIKTMFWDRWMADRITSQSIADACVDWLWHSGNPGISRVQRLVGVNADGIVGPQTLTAINTRRPDELFNSICTERRRFLRVIVTRRPSQKKFLPGWLNRVDALKYNG